MTSFSVRLADPARDADAVAAIYRAAVTATIATFEEEPPTVAEMASRIEATVQRTPWLVAVDPTGRVAGYAYAGPHHARAGYRWSVNISVYVDPDLHRRGVGRMLYAELLAVLRRQGFVNAYAGIALPNPASVALHESIGMRRVGMYPAVGLKFGRWVDVAWYGMRLADPPGTPPAPIAMPDLGGA